MSILWLYYWQFSKKAYDSIIDFNKFHTFKYKHDNDVCEINSGFESNADFLDENIN